MPRLNVRCCCQHTKILGTLELPEGAVERGWWKIIGPAPAGGRARTMIHEIDIWPVQYPHNGRLITEQAVYSEDRPIEFWRQIPGFREGDEV